MRESHSRRSFLAGALISGALSAGANHLFVDGYRTPLTLRSGTDPTGTRGLLVKLWNQARPQAPIDYQEIPGSTGDQFNTFTDTEAADIYNLDAIHIKRFSTLGRGLRKVALPPGQTFLEPLKRVCLSDDGNRLWATPLNADVGMLFRRTGPGEPDGESPGLTSVLAAGVAGKPHFIGQLAWRKENEEAFVVNVMEHALAQDPGLVRPGGSWQFPFARWNTALQPLKNALRDKSVATAPNEADTTAAFKQPSLKYMRNWPLELGTADRSERKRDTTGGVQLATLPSGILGGQYLAISASCSHPEVAEEAVRFLTGLTAQRLLATAGFMPTSLEIYNKKQNTVLIPHLQTMRNAIEGSRARPVHRNYPEFSKQFAAAVLTYLTGGDTVRLDTGFTTRMTELLR
jgi:multiple sugar transport system substrate-binding protein